MCTNLQIVLIEKAKHAPPKGTKTRVYCTSAPECTLRLGSEPGFENIGLG